MPSKVRTGTADFAVASSKIPRVSAVEGDPVVVAPPSYTPALKFNDKRNSMYLPGL